jgi:hypothetical protein
MVRRSVVILGLAMALAPLSAWADQASNDGNQQAINAANAQKAWLAGMTSMQQGVVLGQREMANAQAIVGLLPWDVKAQSRIPNTAQQYNEFCNAAIQQVAAKVANATAMVQARPGDSHAQAELANANAISQQLWAIIGNSYPGNPWQTVAPVAPPTYADDQSADVNADDATVAADDADAPAADALAAVGADDSAEATNE